MKEEIEKFKQQNGNIKYSVKELLYGVNVKIDKIDERLNDGAGKIATNSIRSKISIWGLGIIIVAILGQIFGLIP